MRCLACEAPLADTSGLCPSCGAPLALAAPVADAEARFDAWIGESADRLGRLLDPEGGVASLAVEPAGSREGSSSRAMAPASRSPRSSRGLHLDAEPHGILNLLLLQAGYSPWRRLGLRRSGEDLGVPGSTEVRLEVRAHPPVLEPLEVFPEQAGPGAEDSELVPVPSLEAFRAVDETRRGALRAVLRQGEMTLDERTWAVTIHGFREWLASGGAEPSLAGAITPNSPGVVGWMGSLDRDLRGAMAGDGSERAFLRAALDRLDLRYLGVAPSFEGTGQKILFPDEVLALGRGCCLDLAILSAAVLERAGWWPLVVFVRGHVYNGCWTRNLRARQPVIRDSAWLLERLRNDDLELWDAGRPECRPMTLPEARDVLEAFEMALDVGACRRLDPPIRPLPGSFFEERSP